MKRYLLDVIKQKNVLVSDGAWGTLLQQRGLTGRDCPEIWNLERPNAVEDVAATYLHAGSDAVETNSFGGNRVMLGRHGLGEQATRINRSAAVLSRRAAGEDRFVLGSMGPTGTILMMGEVSKATIFEAFAEQAQALEAGGADAACIETFTALDEATLALRAVRENTNLTRICTFTFERTADGDYRTMMGTSPEEAASALIEAGAEIIGTNCGNGMERMIEIIARLRRTAPETPLLVHANAGLPRLIEGREVYPETPEVMAGFVPKLIEAGANMIGGCCGTGPEHIVAIRQAVDQWRQRA